MVNHLQHLRAPNPLLQPQPYALTNVLQAGDGLQSVNIHHAGSERCAASEWALHQAKQTSMAREA